MEPYSVYGVYRVREKEMAGYRRVDYLKLAEEALRGRDNKTEGLPWPGYNGGKQFCCEYCGTRFDTSVGYAKHQANRCSNDGNEPPEPIGAMES
jgi:hypothetical protein